MQDIDTTKAGERTHLIKAGQTLTARSVGDHDCIFRVDILARNKNFATVKAMGETKRVKIHADGADEFIFAFGRYSMAPTFRASSAVAERRAS